MAGREAMRNRERLEYKFIVEYLSSQHKDIYAEAYNFYQDVKEKNPHIRDLTKTIEFVGKTKPYETIPRYYYRRRSKSTTTSVKQNELTMVLNIPLATTTTTAPSPQPAPLPVQSQPPVSSPQPAPLPVQSQPPVSSPPPATLAVTAQPTAPLPVPLAEASSSPVEPLALPDEIFHHLVSEIQQDPDLWAIFNNFDTISVNNNDDDDDDGMNPQVWNDLSTLNNISPVEMEIP